MVDCETDIDHEMVDYETRSKNQNNEEEMVDLFHYLISQLLISHLIWRPGKINCVKRKIIFSIFLSISSQLFIIKNNNQNHEMMRNDQPSSFNQFYFVNISFLVRER